MNQAQRFAGKPLLQPSYNFRDVPPCTRSLSGSSLSEVLDRQHLVDSIAEMVLLCNEATRRRAAQIGGGGGSNAPKKSCTKPLSLEYIFDRIDTDDPLWGFMIRTDTPTTAKGRASSVKASPQWRRGMLQGFLTVTTFTNWQSTFRFDSFNEAAFAYDDEELTSEMKNGTRKYDRDGRLSEEMQATVRGGDPWTEGVVYPKIAEISLLGGLGCGKPLVRLVIEHLECMKGSGSANYDYVVLQATENSVPFYEAMGFIRIGCVQENIKSPHGFCSSPVETYDTKKNGESPFTIAKQFGVDVWDLIFLNVERFKGILPRSWLKKGTPIFVPSSKSKFLATSEALRSKKLEGSWDDTTAAPKYYTAKENDTPRGLAKKFNVKLGGLLKANKKRLPDIIADSRFRAGTRVKVSRFDQEDDYYVPYCHWTFPDDEFNSDEPSYMMAMKLNRKPGAKAKLRPVAVSMDVAIQKYSPEALGVKDLLIQPKSTIAKKIETDKKGKGGKHPNEPLKPKRPASSYVIFCNEARVIFKQEFKGKHMTECTKLIAEKWNVLSDEAKQPYKEKHRARQAVYADELKKYRGELAKFHHENPGIAAGVKELDTSLLEKVVKLKSSSYVSSKFQYFYVLTYIPDFQWVHLAPMRKVGVFDATVPNANGRPRWMIVDEDEGSEFDTSGALCTVVRSRAVKNTEDADEEEWDIFESGDQPPLAPIFLANRGKPKLPDVSKSDESAPPVSEKKASGTPNAQTCSSVEKAGNPPKPRIAVSTSAKKRKLVSSEGAKGSAKKSKVATVVSDSDTAEPAEVSDSRTLRTRKAKINYSESQSPSKSPKKTTTAGPLHKTPRRSINKASVDPQEGSQSADIHPLEQQGAQHMHISGESIEELTNQLFSTDDNSNPQPPPTSGKRHGGTSDHSAGAQRVQAVELSPRSLQNETVAVRANTRSLNLPPDGGFT